MPDIRDIYQRITDKIIDQLEAGARPWVPEWSPVAASVPRTPRRATGDTYRGINTLMLWLARQAEGYVGNTWLTFRQAADLGGGVRKGESGHLVVKYGTYVPGSQNWSEADEAKQVPFLKGYTVFNVDQIDGLPDRFYPQRTPVAPDSTIPHLEIVDRFVAHTRAKISYCGARACYRPTEDDILMPDRGRFFDETYLYSTLLHELAHWTGAPGRLNRDMRSRFGSASYAAEELVAEMSAAFLCSDCDFSWNEDPV
jgi:antirestriction protein ArdC